MQANTRRKEQHWNEENVTEEVVVIVNIVDVCESK
jgi:hypothetical protein